MLPTSKEPNQLAKYSSAPRSWNLRFKKELDVDPLAKGRRCIPDVVI